MNFGPKVTGYILMNHTQSLAKEYNYDDVDDNNFINDEH